MTEHDAIAARSVADAATRTVRIDGADLAVRVVGPESRIPLVVLIHLGANLDAWDPEVVDALAAERRVILLGYRGVGDSTGRVRDSFDDMAADAIAAIHALGLTRIDLLGLSMGGMVAQAIIQREPDLVRRAVLAGTGPAGGPALTRMTGVMVRGILRSVVLRRPTTSVLFFTRTPAGRTAASAYQERLARPRVDRERAVSPGVIRAQLRAVARWGAQAAPTVPAAVDRVLAFHGDADSLVPVANVASLRTLFPDLEAVVVADAGHGVVSQDPTATTDRIRAFLRG